MSEAIKVVVRVRPMNSKEITSGCQSIVQITESDNQIVLVKPGQADNSKSFAFDTVFGEASQQAVVYQKTAFRLVESVLEGYNGTIFAYGQTGCGKTHSMVGRLDDQHLHGLIPRSFTHVLKVAGEVHEKQFLIRCSFIEIYNEEIHDLLGVDTKAKLDIKESPEKGVFIKDMSINTAKTYDELMNFMETGNRNRSVGETLMNKDSSRSHSMFTLFIESVEKGPKGEDRYVAAKLNLVDLAGSERISKTGVTGDRLKQAQKINLSLSALGNVISALVDGKSQHVPYRDSKLTRLLQDSLGGNTKTVMIANCSPADYNFDETLSTLRYASRAKFIKNKPIINEDPKDALLKQYSEEIKKLKAMLENIGTHPHQNHPTAKQQQQLHKSVVINSESDDRRNMLQAKQLELQEQMRERQRLEQRIIALQQQTVVGTNTHIQPEQIKDLIEAKEHLDKNSRSPSVHRSTSMRDQDNIPNKKSPTEQLEAYVKLDKKQKQKIKNLEREIVDANKQNFADKEVLLDEVRTLVNDTKLNRAVIQMLLTKEQISTLQSRASYNEQKEVFELAKFSLKDKRPSLPKLELHKVNNSSDKLDPIKAGVKKISIKCIGNLAEPGSKDSFCLNNIIKEAKVDYKDNGFKIDRLHKASPSSFSRPK